MHCVDTIKMIKQVEKMPNLGKGSVFQSTVLTIIHKNITKVQTDAYYRVFIFSYDIIFIKVT